MRCGLCDALLVPEMTCAGEHHGDAMIVGGLDHFGITH
jgi:hypothetical protein